MNSTQTTTVIILTAVNVIFTALNLLAHFYLRRRWLHRLNGVPLRDAHLLTLWAALNAFWSEVGTSKGRLEYGPDLAKGYHERTGELLNILGSAVGRIR